MRFKLANIVLDGDGVPEGGEELLYCRSGAPGVGHVSYDAENRILSFSGEVDFLTYFNAFALAKWRQYTSVDNVLLHLELSGSDCDVALRRAGRAGRHGCKVSSRTVCSFREGEGPGAVEIQGEAPDVASCQLEDGWWSVDVSMDMDDSVLVGVYLASAGVTCLRNAYFATETNPDRIRSVRLALSTTTFNNEEYIIPNIGLVRSHVLESSEPIAESFHMFVVDNGRTLDAEALSGNGVTVLPNPNVGGSGGFARGMVEALGQGATGAHEPPFTHVLLMDDDVRVSPESFIRTFNLLSLVNETYADAFVQGAMLRLQEPDVQFEDVSFVRHFGGYQIYKKLAYVSDVADIVLSENTPVEGRDKSYGAWWFSCIPVSAVQQRGLPLPLFIRIDDVEYGARQPATFMTMAGVCVWHSNFVGRFRPSVDLYQYGRNMLVANACSDLFDERAFMAKYWRNFETYTRFLAYDKAELWLDALEHYLAGPEWLASVDGAELMKSNSARNEKMLTFEELSEEDKAVVRQAHLNLKWVDEEGNGARPLWWLAAEALPYNRHRFPRFVLRDSPGVIYYADTMSPWYETAMRSVLVAVDNSGKRFHVRRLDKRRYRALAKRATALKRDYRVRGAEVAQAYREAAPHLQSVDFWRDYLGLQGD